MFLWIQNLSPTLLFLPSLSVFIATSPFIGLYFPSLCSVMSLIPQTSSLTGSYFFSFSLSPSLPVFVTSSFISLSFSLHSVMSLLPQTPSLVLLSLPSPFSFTVSLCYIFISLSFISLHCHKLHQFSFSIPLLASSLSHVLTTINSFPSPSSCSTLHCHVLTTTNFFTSSPFSSFSPLYSILSLLLLLPSPVLLPSSYSLLLSFTVMSSLSHSFS